MDDREVVRKVVTYLQTLPKGQKLTYSQVASAVDLPHAASQIKRIIKRSDSPYFRSVLGGVKTMGQGTKKTIAARRASMSQRRGFLRKIFEADPEATMKPGVSFEGGRIKLGQNDRMDDSQIAQQKSSSVDPKTKPDIDLAI